MGQSNLDFEGAIMKKSIIEASFGLGEIQQIRNDRTIVYS